MFRLHYNKERDALCARVGEREGDSLAKHAKNAGEGKVHVLLSVPVPGGMLPPPGYLKLGGHSRERESLEFHESATRTWEQELKDIRSGHFCVHPPLLSN